jgi:hypothetical protein
MHILNLLVIACSVFSLQAMLRDQATRLIAASVLRTHTHPRLLSGTPSCTSFDDAYSWHAFDHKDCRFAWNSVFKLLQTAHHHPNSDAECLEDEGEIARLFNDVAHIKRRREELEISTLGGFSNYSRVDTARRKFWSERFPLVAAADALAELHTDIAAIIPEITNVVPLVFEVAGFQSDQRVIEQTLNAIKRDWQWTEQCRASIETSTK